MIPSTDAAPPSQTAVNYPGVERALLLAIGVLALVLVHNSGTSDLMAFWVPFYKGMKGVGFIQGYHNTALDYPPLSHGIILCAGNAGEASGADSLTGIKYCLLFFSFVSTAVFRGFWRGGIPLVLVAAAAVQNGVVLGYLDVLYVPTLLLALWALGRRHIALFSVLFGVSCFIKWQPLIFAPFCAWHALRPVGARPEDGLALNLSRTVRLVVPGVVLILVVVLTYGKDVVEAFQGAMNDTFLSGEALNINWAATYLLERWHPGAVPPLHDGQATTMDISTLHGWGWVPKLAFIGLYLITLWRFHRGANTFGEFLRASLLGFLTYCMFNTGVHENHYYVATILACTLAAVDGRAMVQAVLVTAMAVVNLVIFYGLSGGGLHSSRVVGGVDLTFVLSLGYVGLYGWWWRRWMRQVETPPDARQETVATGEPEASNG